jgi:hypothetical protein
VKESEKDVMFVDNSQLIVARRDGHPKNVSWARKFKLGRKIKT